MVYEVMMHSYSSWEEKRKKGEKVGFPIYLMGRWIIDLRGPQHRAMDHLQVSTEKKSSH